MQRLTLTDPFALLLLQVFVGFHWAHLDDPESSPQLEVHDLSHACKVSLPLQAAYAEVL
jgi:hypothetical protein